MTTVVIVEHAPTKEVVVQHSAPREVVVQRVGARGADGSSAANLVVSPTDPGLTEPGLWVQTGLPNNGVTIWIEDGL